MKQYYVKAELAFIDLYEHINKIGTERGNGTKAIFNCGFYISDPLDRDINTPCRKWSKKYADREWEWYLSQNRSVEKLKKYAPIWDQMHNGDNIVNSNYGFLWNENNQLKYCIEHLKNNQNTRQAYITLFDGKKKNEYAFDTPCTLSIGFTILNGRLNMTILMRSNDLWYGFCNDQYCFSKLQELVAEKLSLPVGWYYHFAADMHIYERHYLKSK